MARRGERQNEYRGMSKLAAIRVDNIDDSLEVSNPTIDQIFNIFHKL